MPRSHRDRSSSSHSGHHHHRSRSRSRSRRIFRLKHKERNFLAAVCSMFVIVTMATALAEPKWFTVKGGGCNTKTLGVYQFFYPGTFYIDTESNVVYHYGHGLHDGRYKYINVCNCDSCHDHKHFTRISLCVCP